MPLPPDPYTPQVLFKGYRVRLAETLEQWHEYVFDGYRPEGPWPDGPDQRHVNVADLKDTINDLLETVDFLLEGS